MKVESMSKLSCVYPISYSSLSEGTLICFHPGGMPSKYFVDLDARLSGWNLVLVELQLNELYMNAYDKERQQLNHNIDEIVSDVINQLGDFVGKKLAFIGWSFGGVMAYKVACEIANKKDSKLILLDSISPIFDFDPDKGYSSFLVVKWFVEFINAIKNSNVKYSGVNIAFSEIDEVIAGLLLKAKKAGAFDASTKVSGLKKLYTTFLEGMYKNSKLTSVFEPNLFLGRVLLVKASSGLFWRFKFMKFMGWKSITPNISRLTVKTDHYKLVGDSAVMEQYFDHINEFIGNNLTK